MCAGHTRDMLARLEVEEEEGAEEEKEKEEGKKTNK